MRLFQSHITPTIGAASAAMLTVKPTPWIANKFALAWLRRERKTDEICSKYASWPRTGFMPHFRNVQRNHLPESKRCH